MTEQVRIAVAGAGLIGARHARLIAATPGCRLVGVIDPAETATALAADLGAPRFSSLVEMPVDLVVDALVVATPNRTHEAVGVAAAERGLHLLVEKPIAHDLASARRLVAAAEANQVRLLVGHHRRHHPFVAEARRMLAEGGIGRLRAVSAHWLLRKHDAYYADPWRVEAGGGPVLINLIHDIDMLRYLCGEIAEIRAMTGNAARGLVVEDAAAILLRFDEGALGTLLGSDAAPSPWAWEPATGENPTIPAAGEDCYRLFGSEGALGLPSLTLWRHHGAVPGDWSLPLSAAPPAAPPAGNPLARQLDHFLRVVRGGEAPLVDGADATRSLAATLAVARAAGLDGVDPRSL